MYVYVVLLQQFEIDPETLGARAHYPRFEFCSDNGAMIAFAGAQRLLAGERAGLGIAVRARWPMTELQAPA